MSEQKLYEILENLNISYVKCEHSPVYTVEEAVKHWTDLDGTHCKNLFLRNKKGNNHYLVILEGSKRADLKDLNIKLDEDRLSFGSPERLKRYLGLETGAVSPFGLINDTEKKVKVVIDEDLKQAAKLNFHPNINTATLVISYNDFEKFLSWCGNTIRYFKL